MIESGLYEIWNKFHLTKPFKNDQIIYQKEDCSNHLTLDHISCAFYFLFYFSFLSFIAFIIEITIRNCKKPI